MAIFITPGGGSTSPGGSTTELQYNNAGAFAGISTLTYDGTTLTTAGRMVNSFTSIASTPAKTFRGTWFTGGTATTTKPHLLIEPTGTTSTAWSTSGTGLGVNAASGFAGNLLDLQVNGTSRFAVNSGGSFTSLSDTTTGTVFTAANSRLSLSVEAGPIIRIGRPHLNSNYAWLKDTGASFPLQIGISSTSASESVDVVITRDAANTLAQRNSTNAQTFRVYNTYTSGTSYELGKLEWSSNVFRIGTEKGSGGGTARTVEVHTDSIARLALDTTGSVRVVTGLTVATLPGTPAVGMVARVTDASAPAVGSTVAGGGAAAALVWYNGANWTVIGV